MSKVLTLKHPFDFGDRKITELTFNRLKGKHLKKLPASPAMGDMMELASKSATEAPAIFEEMDAEDVGACLEIVGDFIGASRPTGESA